MGKPDIYVYDIKCTIQPYIQRPELPTLRQNVGDPLVLEGLIFPNQTPKFYGYLCDIMKKMCSLDTAHVKVEAIPCSASGKPITKTPWTVDTFLTHGENGFWTANPKTLRFKF